MNILKVIFFTLVISLLFVSKAQASGNCTGFYGEPISNDCAKITVDKKVLKPGTKDYVDGLSVVDPKYRAKDNVVFQIVVQNIGTQDITNVEVTDYLPQNMTFVSGPGSYDASKKKVTFTLATLKKGESQTYYITAKIDEDIALGNGTVCLVNSVRVEKKDRASAEDNAQFCVERVVYPAVKGAKQTPPTGPEAAALPMLAGMAGAGLYLLRKARV